MQSDAFRAGWPMGLPRVCMCELWQVKGQIKVSQIFTAIWQELEL